MRAIQETDATQLRLLFEKSMGERQVLEKRLAQEKEEKRASLKERLAERRKKHAADLKKRGAKVGD